MTAPSSPNLAAGIGGAVVGAVVGAIGWSLLVSATDYKIGYAAVGVGALAGLFAGKLGRGATNLPVIAAAIGLIGCVLGDIFTDGHEVAKELGNEGHHTSTIHIVKLMFQHPSSLGWPVYKAGFDAIDVLFYAFAAVAAFRLATQHAALHKARSVPSTYAAPTAPASELPPPPAQL